MVSLIKKPRGKKAYWYLVKSARVGGKSRIVWQKYLGTPEKIMEMYGRGESMPSIKLHSVEFGKTAALLRVSKELNFVEIVNRHTSKKKIEGLTVGEYMLLIILGRSNGPLSKTETARWFKKSFLSFVWKFPHKLNCQNFLAHMDYLTEDAMRKIEEDLARILLGKGIEPSRLIWDTTNFFGYWKESGKLRKKGKSKEHRNDKNLVGLGLLVSDEGIPFMHEVYPGNEHDAELFPKIIEKIVKRLTTLKLDIKDLDLVLVFDKGNNSEDNIGEIPPEIHFVGSLKRNQVKKILRVPRAKYKAVYEGAKQKEKKLLAYETKDKVFGKEFTIVSVYNPASYRREARSYRKSKSKTIKKLEELKKKAAQKGGRGRKMTKSGLTNSAVDAVPKDLRRLFKLDIRDEGGLSLDYSFDEKASRELYNGFGKIVLFTDVEKNLTEIVEAYSSKWQVEEDFKWLKDRLLVPLKPFFHWLDDRIRVHASLCVIGLLFYRYLAWMVRDFGLSDRKLLDELEGIRLAVVHAKSVKEPEIVVEEMSGLKAKLFSVLKLAEFVDN